MVQELPGQQGWPGPPQAAQVPATQATDGDVQVGLPPPAAVQQGWPGPPQVPQLPPAQVPPKSGQVEPEPVQVPLLPLVTQQPPPLHVVAAQQAWPAPPHWVQTPAPPPVQTSLASQARPAQQTWPGAPHAWQTPPTHAPPVHMLPGQQAVPRAPHISDMSPGACVLSELHPIEQQNRSKAK